MRRLARFALLLLLAAPPLATAEARAQTAPRVTIRVEGETGDRAGRVLRDILAADRYLYLDRDTVLPADFATDADLVVHDATVYLEGRVTGRAAVLGGTLFVRPGARLDGPIAVIDGLALPSARASVGDIVELAPAHTTSIEKTEGVHVVLIERERVAVVGLPGWFGVRRLSYDRVDGIALEWGPQWRILRREEGPTLDVWGGYRSARGALAGGARLGVPLGAGVEVTAVAERATVTNERWFRGDLENTLGALFLGRDPRDYYESDRLALELRRPLLHAPVSGEVGLGPYLRLSTSRDRSLAAAGPWSLLGGEGLRRPNPPVLEGRITSLVAGTALAWEGNTSRFDGAVAVERALGSHGDTAFTHWTGVARWQMQALWNHSLGVAAHARGTLGARPAPPQRWSFVGGAGTLPVLPLAQHRGDRLVLLTSDYTAPLGFVSLPLAGVPELRLLHATGTAWTTGEPMPEWEQNLGAGLRLSWLELQLWIDPAARRRRPTVLLQLVLP